MKACGLTKFLSLTIAVLFVAAASGCQYILPKEEESLAPPLLQPKSIVYTTVDVARGDMQQTVQGVGRFESVKMVNLSYSQSGGRLKSIDTKVGLDVKKGDIVAELDTQDLDFRIKVEQLKLQEMQNNYASMKKAMKHARDKTQLTNAGIDVQIEQLTVQQLLDQKADSILRSPIDGSVVDVTNADLGDAIDAYSMVVCIADRNEKMLTYEGDSGTSSFQIGMKVQVALSTDKTKTTEGEIVATPRDMVSSDPTKANSTVYIKVPDDFMQNVQVGDEASVMLILAERKNVLKLPRNVVKTYLERRYVEALVDGVKVEKDVQVGLQTATECEIISGLAEGDKVIVS